MHTFHYYTVNQNELTVIEYTLNIKTVRDNLSILFSLVAGSHLV